MELLTPLFHSPLSNTRVDLFRRYGNLAVAFYRVGA